MRGPLAATRRFKNVLRRPPFRQHVLPTGPRAADHPRPGNEPTMTIARLLAPDRVGCCHRASSKKRVLEDLSELLAGAAPDLTVEEIFTSLLERERLGSTGLGGGVAIPHGRMAGLAEPIGAFVQLREAIPFDAVDDRPVDLLFALLVPEDADEVHLGLLAQLARMFADEAFCARLRQAGSDAELLALLQQWQPPRATA